MGIMFSNTFECGYFGKIDEPVSVPLWGSCFLTRYTNQKQAQEIRVSVPLWGSCFLTEQWRLNY